MSDDPWLTAISPDDIEAAMQRKAAREALIVEQAAEITRLRAELATARREGMEDAAKIVINLSISTPSVIAAAIRAAAGEEK